MYPEIYFRFCSWKPVSKFHNTEYRNL